MAKTKTRSSQPPNADNQHLDQTIEHLTEEVARTASRFRIPLILLVVAVIGGILITQLMGKIEDVQRQGTNDEIAAFFSGSTAEIRSGASRLLETVRSEKIEPFVVSRYALWLFVQISSFQVGSGFARWADSQTRFSAARRLCWYRRYEQGNDHFDFLDGKANR